MKLSKLAVFSDAPMHRVTEEDLAILRSAAPETEIFLVSTPEELAEKAPDVDAIFTMPVRDFAPLIRYCEADANLKWLQLMTAGFDFLFGTPFESRPGLTVTSTIGIHGEPISDHALAMMFAHVRLMPHSYALQREHKWEMAVPAGYDEVGRKTVGIIGPGAIGMCLARKCKALGMRVYGAKRTPVQSEFLDYCWPIAQLDEMLAVSDFVVVTSPLTAETRGMLNAARFAAMKPGAYVINLARGPIIETDALVDAIRSGHISGAGLDVTDPEPLPADSPLWDLPGVTITSHVSAQSPYYFERALENYCENVRRYLADEPLRNVCKKPDGVLTK
ncbi:MAG: D-2-hydroxyacid dehydrogenase [Bradyrhizobium sp.]